MEWEVEITEARPVTPRQRKPKFTASIILRYVLEAIIFGFLAGAIGYGIEAQTGWDGLISYPIGIVLVAVVYFVYLTRIMGIEGLK